MPQQTVYQVGKPYRAHSEEKQPLVLAEDVVRPVSRSQEDSEEDRDGESRKNQNDRPVRYLHCSSASCAALKTSAVIPAYASHSSGPEIVPSVATTQAMSAPNSPAIAQ